MGEVKSYDFEIVTTRMGVLSIRDNATMEIMHNPVGPWVEANSLYIEQSKLAKRLSLCVERELVVFDVGLGAGANALAALHCARTLPQRRPLRLVSFERDLSLLQFALDNSHHFAHFKGYESAVRSILATGRWQGDGIVWELRHGDFLELIEREETRAHLVFYDPYSSAKNMDMWTAQAFKRVHRACVSSEDEGALLLTYSRATPIRVAMFLAGFFVGTGTATGAKDETTQAATLLAELEHPLGAAWLERWKKSDRQNSAGAAPEELAAVRAFILAHPQLNLNSR
ncbi:MAG: hypothetical protein KF799_07885 [Bdellovibrionales bacterium]|nr:hypothetical protein [Bdellovibrionales bacterium]